MIEALFNQPNFVAAQRMMDLTALRHEAIAANLANLETPNYRRIDVAPAFEQGLQEAIARRDLNAVRSASLQLAPDSTAVARRRDGNTVELESELVRLNRNSVEHSVESHLVTGALLRLRLAITGRPA